MVVILSLDSSSPYFPLVEVDGIPNADILTRVIRKCILDYRRVLSEQNPNLYEFMLSYIGQELSEGYAKKLKYWCDNVFVFSSIDYEKYIDWMDILADLFKSRVFVDDRYGLPDRLADTAKEKFLRETSLADFHHVQDENEDEALSDWDTEMYARHGLFDEERDPAVPLKLTFKQLRFRRFTKWLIEQLDTNELAHFQNEIRTAFSARFDPFTGRPELPDLSTQVLPHA